MTVSSWNLVFRRNWQLIGSSLKSMFSQRPNFSLKVSQMVTTFFFTISCLYKCNNLVFSYVQSKQHHWEICVTSMFWYRHWQLYLTSTHSFCDCQLFIFRQGNKVHCSDFCEFGYMVVNVTHCCASSCSWTDYLEESIRLSM